MIKKLVYLRFLIAISLVILITGCATNSFLPVKPNISVTGIKLDKFAFKQQSFYLHLTVDNPNRFDIPVLNTDFNVAFNNKKLVSASSKELKLLKAGQKTTIPLQFSTNFIKTWSDFSEILRNRQLNFDYRVSGSLSLDAKYFPIAVPFSKSGNLLSKIQK